MKKAKWLFFVCWLLAAIAGCAETAPMPEEGLYTIGVQSSSRMFNITKCVLQVRDGQMTAVITLSGTVMVMYMRGPRRKRRMRPLIRGYRMSRIGRRIYLRAADPRAG